MGTITTDNFTKALFHILDLEWNHHADARHLLSEIIVEEENVITVMEDVIFCLSQFLEHVNGSTNNLKPYYTTNDCHNCFYVGNGKNSKLVFIITICDDSYIFQRSLDQDPREKIHCSNLDELEEALLNYFVIFYNQFKGE